MRPCIVLLTGKKNVQALQNGMRCEATAHYAGKAARMVAPGGLLFPQRRPCLLILCHRSSAVSVEDSQPASQHPL